MSKPQCAADFTVHASTHDVVIIGGGPIGCALACALKGSGHDVLVLEAKQGPGRIEDTRTLALSWGSRLILQRLGVWESLPAATPIHRIHVSQRGGFGRTELRAEELDLPALGYVVRYADLQRSLLDQALVSGAVLREGTAVADVLTEADGVSVVGADSATPAINGRLAVIADGGLSLGAKVGARFRSVDYRQAAIVGTVRTDRMHANCAFERFTADGPIALLPHGETYALVWSCAPAQAPKLMALDKKTFLAQLQSHFGDRAGRFIDIHGRAGFPLSLRYARNPVLQRTVMLGNAAQSLHPIAGQGFNLGLRDSWEIADAIAHRGSEDPGIAPVMSAYRQSRKSDRIAGIALTDALTRVFSNDWGPLALLRGCGIAALDVFPPAKRFLMRRMIFGSGL